MKRITVAIIALLLTLETAAAETTLKWWGLTSFRQRLELYEENTDISFQGGAGQKLYDLENGTTKLGYQLGVIAEVRENVTLGLTLRSGLSGNAQVMLQDIDNKEGLLPAIQEAYINWKSPFAIVELGKIPQQGNAMWDIFGSTMKTDPARQDDPRDSYFNDRIAALNGFRISRTIGFITPRLVYHAEAVDGYKRENSNPKVIVRKPDRNVVLVGANANIGEIGGMSMLEGLTVDFDFGFPKRAAKIGTNPDSTYADEELYGAGLMHRGSYGAFGISYGHGFREGLYNLDYIDVMARMDVAYHLQMVGLESEEFLLTFKYQDATQKMEFDPYKGAEAVRNAMHLYIDKRLWGLDFQPRVIWFATDIEGFRNKTLTRYELTTTVRF